MIGNFLGNFEKLHSCVKTAAATVWATFGNILATFDSNTSNTGYCHEIRVDT